MSRDDGFPVADVDSAYFEDSKMRDLWQRVRDPDLMARAVVLHAATLLGSWRQGERITVGQATPLWMVTDGDVVDHLKAVKLLDRGGKIPSLSWTKWFGPAFGRREARRDAGRIGGLASVKGRSSDASPSPNASSSSAEPVRPSVRPSVPTVPSAPSIGRAKNGINPGEERRRALEHLSEEYKAGRLSEVDYERQRRVLAS